MINQNVAIGAKTAAAAGDYLAYYGDRYPLNQTTATLAQTIGEKKANVPDLSPVDSSDNLFKRAAGKTTCQKTSP